MTRLFPDIINLKVICIKVLFKGHFDNVLSIFGGVTNFGDRCVFRVCNHNEGVEQVVKV